MFLLLAKITAENSSPTVRALTLAPRRLAVPAACLDLILPLLPPPPISAAPARACPGSSVREWGWRAGGLEGLPPLYGSLPRLPHRTGSLFQAPATGPCPRALSMHLCFRLRLWHRGGTGARLAVVGCHIRPAPQIVI